MNSLVKQSFRILLGRGSVSAVGLLFTVYFAYELPKNLFALIALYGTAASFTQVMIDLGLGAKMVREAPSLLKDDATYHKAIVEVIMPSLLFRFMAALVTCLLMIFFLQLMKGILSDEFQTLNVEYIILVAPLAMMFENGNTTLANLFQIRRRFGLDSMLTSLAQVLELVFATILYVNFGMNQYFVGVFFAQFSIFCLRIYLSREVLKLFTPGKLNFAEARSMLRIYFPYYLRRFFRFGLLQGEQLLVVILLPLAQLADFNLAKRLSKYIKVYVEAFSNPLIIKLSKSRDMNIRKQHVRTFLLFTIPPPILLCLLSPWIMKIAGGDKYAGSWIILAVMYLSYVFYALSTLQLSVITIFGKGTDVLYRDIIGSVVGFCATLALILIYGQYGLAWGQLIAYFTLFVAGYHISKKFLNAENSTAEKKENPPDTLVPPDPA